MLEKEELMQKSWETRRMKYYLDYYLQHRDELFLQLEESMVEIDKEMKKSQDTSEPKECYYRDSLGSVKLDPYYLESMGGVLNSLFILDYMDFMESYGDTYDYDGGIVLVEIEDNLWDAQVRLEITSKPIKKSKTKKNSKQR